MLYGTARITAVDAHGNTFDDDVGVGDLEGRRRCAGSRLDAGPDAGYHLVHRGAASRTGESNRISDGRPTIVLPAFPVAFG